MGKMKPDKKKDNLTDLVEEVSSTEGENSPTSTNDGQVVASDGDVVTLNFGKQIDELARKLVKVTKKNKK